MINGMAIGSWQMAVGNDIKTDDNNRPPAMPAVAVSVAVEPTANCQLPPARPPEGRP